VVHEEVDVMNERLRRVLIFIIIVGTGTLLIFIDLPLIIILPLIVLIGIVLLVLLGAIPLSELKARATARFRKGGQKAPAAAQKPAAQAAPAGKRFSFSLGTLFRKKEPAKAAAVPAPKAVQQTAPQPGILGKARSLFARKPVAAAAGKPSPAPVAEKKTGISLHIGSLMSSVKAMGTILTTRKKTDPDKMKKIDSMLDHAVSEKVDLAPQPAVPPVQEAPPAAAAAAGGAVAGGPGEDDPFLSLSGDELDAGLLDGLDDDVAAGPSPLLEPGAPAEPLSMPDLDEGLEAGAGSPELLSPESPALDAETAAAADDILKANEAGLGDLPALEGLDAGDGELGGLDNLSLDSVDLDEDDEEEEIPGTAAPAPAPAAAPAAAAPAPAEAPAKPRSDQSEMASFAAASGGDDDMLSSLAADIKTVKKEQDISLLRELKDFRAPGTEIETELSDLYTVLNAAAEKQKRLKPPGVRPPGSKPAARPAAGKKS
jgi:hypothetical protein